MNFKSETDSYEPIAFLLTPALNLMFVIILFFATGQLLLTEDKVAGINLAAAQTAVDGPDGAVAININAAGAVIFGGRERNAAAVAESLAKLAFFYEQAAGAPEVIIRADARAPLRQVVELVDLCKRNGIKQIDLAVVAAVE